MVLAGFVVLVAGDILIHRIWLGEIYKQYAGFWRSAEEMKANAWIPFLAELCLAYLLAVVYPKGLEGKSTAGEGLRFGILMGLLLYLPSILMKRYLYPYPTYLLGVWFLGGVLEITLAGVAIALTYQRTK